MKKLINKETSEIGRLSVDINRPDNGIRVYYKDGITYNMYNSLAELNEKWEDYEDTKDHWCVSFYGEAKRIGKYANSEDIAQCKQIGNYFETKEEAEEAVKKLKAWQRLKDKGFKFIGVRGIGKVIDFDIPEPYNHVGFDEYTANKDEIEFYDDLLLLFGGEE